MAINADFWSQVLQGRMLKPLDFALGAAMAMPRARLEKIGGFTPLLEYLADDYQLGHRIAHGGAHIELCPVVVECRSAPAGWRETWAHQLRWARTIRVSQPLPWFFSIVSNALLWPTLLVLCESSPITWAIFTTCLGARIATAAHNQWRSTHSANHLPYFWLVPCKDLTHAFLWALSFVGSRIQWRGRDFKVLRGGKLEGRIHTKIRT